jgi:hypothetical protein
VKAGSRTRLNFSAIVALFALTALLGVWAGGKFGVMPTYRWNGRGRRFVG